MPASNTCREGHTGPSGHFFNPWSRQYDSEIDYGKPAKDIVADCCLLATRKLMSKLRNRGQDTQDAIVAAAYSRAIRTIRRWNPAYPLYGHCWQAVHSVYPSILKSCIRHQYVHLDSYEDIARAIPAGEARLTEREMVEDDIDYAKSMGITPMFDSYDEYASYHLLSRVRDRIRPGTVRSPSSI